MSSPDFYRAFEERYRGPRELIRKRLEAYLPFIAPLPGMYQPAHAIDLGCGRGEWLELLQGAGFMPQGVDLDAGMLAACIKRGLPVMQGDAIAHLKSLGDESQCIVSGFHIAEHIAFDDLQALVQHALRVLKPGGLLILETPNPENLVVGTSGFYLDPTHLRPIPPLLLSFLPEHHGFTRVHTVRLQEPSELHQRCDIGLVDVFDGVSPDYAVVAQKAAAPEILASFEAAFATRYGVDLHELVGRYDSTLDRRMRAMESHMQEQEQRVAAAEASAQDQLKRINELGANARRLQQQACMLEAERNALRQSASWRITAPLRAVATGLQQSWRTLRNGANRALHGTINALQKPLSWLIAAVLRRPRISKRINQWLVRYPALNQQLLGVARRGGVIPGASVYSPQGVKTAAQVKPELANLTPRARQIYADLKAAIEAEKGNS